jgi:integrase
MMSVYPDKKAKGNRKKWIADVTMRHPDGRELRRKKRARTQAEASEAERALETQLKKELYTPELIEKPKAPTMKAFIPDFMAWYATQQKPSTAYVREHHIKKYILPYFGEMALNEVSTAKCAAFVSYLRGRGLVVAQSLNSITTALSVMMKRAKALGFIGELPDIEHNKVATPEAESLSEEEFSTLLDALPSENWRAAVLLAGVCGLRRNEVMALQWGDILFDRKLIHVKRNVWKQQEITPKGGEARFVPMTDDIIEELKALPHKTGPVCKGIAAAKLGKIFKRNNLSGKAWHSLRHLALTRLGNAGTPIHTLAKIAGHKRIETTQIYLHSDQDDLVAAAGRLGRVIPPSGLVTGHEAESLSTSERLPSDNETSYFGDPLSNTSNQTDTYPQTLSLSQEALSALLASLSASCPLVSSSYGPPAEPGLYTQHGLDFFALELAELAELRGAL